MSIQFVVFSGLLKTQSAKHKLMEFLNKLCKMTKWQDCETTNRKHQQKCCKVPKRKRFWEQVFPRGGMAGDHSCTTQLFYRYSGNLDTKYKSTAFFSSRKFIFLLHLCLMLCCYVCQYWYHGIGIWPIYVNAPLRLIHHGGLGTTHSTLLNYLQNRRHFRQLAVVFVYYFQISKLN